MQRAGPDIAFGAETQLGLASFRLWPTLTLCAGIWIWEGVFVAFFASIETSEIFFDEERESSKIPQADNFGNPNLIGPAPSIRLMSGYYN